MFALLKKFLFCSTLLVLSACLFDEGDPHSAGVGSLDLNLSLSRAEPALRKSASADTTFDIDSVIVILSAPGAATRTYRAPISGRADLGTIAVSLPIFADLEALRTWKAKILSIDISTNPAHRDTVHLDSMTFDVHVGDTAEVNMIARAAFSILRVRFISTSNDSLASGIRYLRMAVSGVTRDSISLSTRGFNATWFSSTTLGWLVGDAGRISKSTNSGTSWTIQPSGTATNLLSVTAPSTSVLFASGDAGLILKTTDGGTSWGPQSTGTARRLSQVFFVSTTKGYAVGDSLLMLKTTDGGSNWSPLASISNLASSWFAQGSGVSSSLRDVAFADASVGVAVGDGGVIRRTTNGGSAWTGVASPVATDLYAVDFSGTTGYASGAGGRILKSANSGGSWAALSSGTTQPLYGLDFASTTAGIAVGPAETVRWTTDAGSNWNGPAQGWIARSSGTTNALYGVQMVTSTTGWAVGASRRILKTADAGESWTSQYTGTGTWYGVYAASASEALVVGSGTGTTGSTATLRRTTNGGTSWTGIDPGTDAELHGVWVNADHDRYYVVGASGAIRRSTNGTSWSSQSGGSGTLNAVHSNDNRVWVVGDDGAVFRRTSTASGSFTDYSDDLDDDISVASSTDLNAVYCVNDNVTYIAADGGDVYKTTNNGSSWINVSISGVSDDLRGLHFYSATEGYVVGESGGIWKTTNGGTSWTAQAGGTTQTLNGVSVNPGDNNVVLAVGNNGTILKIDPSATLSGQATAQNLKGVYMASTTDAYAVGANGTILKTTNGGLNWTAQSSGTTVALNGVRFVSTSVGWAFGAGGKILKTTNGGANWTAQASGASAELTRGGFVNANVGWVVGDDGTILRTSDGGSTWTAQVSGTGENLFGIHAISESQASAAGAGGVLLKTENGDAPYARPVNLNSTYFRGDTGYVVGDAGLSLRTTNGGTSWSALTGGSQNLYSVFVSPSGNNVYAVGAAGEYLTTSNASFTSAWDVRASGTAKTLRGVWVAGSSPGPAAIYAVGDDGVFRARTDGSIGDLNVGITSGTPEALLGIQCQGTTNNCWAVGGDQTVTRSTNVTTWTLKTSGTKLFDESLAYKYLKPGQSNTVVIQAIDRASPLRGYQSILNLTLGAGQDSTLNSGMTKCGYGGSTPACSL